MPESIEYYQNVVDQGRKRLEAAQAARDQAIGYAAELERVFELDYAAYLEALQADQEAHERGVCVGSCQQPVCQHGYCRNLNCEEGAKCFECDDAQADNEAEIEHERRMEYLATGGDAY